jgi:hypothetical protein
MGNDNMRDRNDDIFTKVIKAGKRTYFFDIKSTKGNDLYLTITESKKTIEDGKESYQKHKIFLYKEDFQKFREGFEETIEKLEELKGSSTDANEELAVKSDFDAITFESL